MILLQKGVSTDQKNVVVATLDLAIRQHAGVGPQGNVFNPVIDRDLGGFAEKFLETSDP